MVVVDVVAIEMVKLVTVLVVEDVNLNESDRVLVDVTVLWEMD